MIEIVINARYMSQPLTGVQRYATEVLRQLDEMVVSGRIDSRKYHIVLTLPPGVTPTQQFKQLEIQNIGRLHDNLWEHFSLGRFAAGKILYNPCNTGPILHGRKQAITIHDASVFALPSTYTFLFRTKYQILIWWLGRRGAVIYTGSEFSKKELVRYCGLDPRKLEVVHLGHEHILSQPADDSLLNEKVRSDQPYILAVGSQSFHKNSAGIMKAISMLTDRSVNLVLTGGVFSKVFRTIPNDPGVSVQRLGYVTDANLRSLYNHAAVFIYPSFYEGFGLPPLEAMACGCPVIVSDRASLPEVCGDAAEYCNPEDPVDIARAIRRVLDDADYRQELIRKGYERAARFHWRDAAEKIWQGIEKIAG